MGLHLTILDSARGEAAGAGPPRAPWRSEAPNRLIDSHGRTIRDLRLSITDRCNFRCVYCMALDTQFAPRSELLSAVELARLAGICARLGVRKVRLTGGEPTVREDFTEIIRGVAAAGIRDIAATTNGALVDDASAAEWRAAGLTRITISLDTLRADRFAAITRSHSSPERVLAAIGCCRRAGLKPIKLNAVIVRGLNDDEVADLAALAREHAIDVRFIEFMPLDGEHAWGAEKVVSAEEIVASVRERFEIRTLDRDEPSETAFNFEFADGAPGRIGVIAPVSRPFCGACSRLRITAEGRVRPCLFSRKEWDVRSLLRGGADDEAIAGFLADVTWTKQAGHGIRTPGFEQPARPMSAIGG